MWAEGLARVRSSRLMKSGISECKNAFLAINWKTWSRGRTVVDMKSRSMGEPLRMFLVPCPMTSWLFLK